VTNSTKRSWAKSSRPQKPHKDFPLSIHKGRGYWCKKVKGKQHYFGKVADDPQGVSALEEWLRVKDDLLAGREPQARAENALAVADLCNQFLTSKQALRGRGQLTPRTFKTYYITCERLVKQFGKTRHVVNLLPTDFAELATALGRTLGPVALGNEIQRVRTVFKFAFDDGYIPTPMRFGQTFAKPSASVIRKAREEKRNERGDRMFEANELRDIVATTKPALKAMVLLGANCGLGQSDLSALPLRALDLERGWLNYARVKTGVPRRVPLWPETVEAIKAWLPKRPKPKDPADEGLVFLTVRGARWVTASPIVVDEKGKHTGGTAKDGIGKALNKVLTQLGTKRPGVGFYALRHGFETVAGETGDQVAVDAIMGHTDNSMAGKYRERISDERLERVVNHVRQWLWPEAELGGEE
jgi:integrase